ncbi:MAG: SpoIIIAH-like family protein [Ruminococcaceae bacterium]|nr:SpoIIIAH-like family protein [Oscillospiraceae bacterium]
MNMQQVKQKVTGFCKKIGKRNFIIAGAVLLVGAAVAINVAVYAKNRNDGYDYDQSAGMDVTQAPEQTQEPNTSVSDSYFASVMVNRQRSRDEAMEVLQAVVDNESSTETAKNEALSKINEMAKIMETEANIESLIVAKGFEECVAVISGEKASVVVRSDGLQPAQIAQISTIVYEQAGIIPANLTITER